MKKKTRGEKGKKGKMENKGKMFKKKNEKTNQKTNRKTEKNKKWKNRECRNDKNGPLKNAHFGPENTGEPPSNVWFSWEQSAFSGRDYFCWGFKRARPLSHKTALLYPKARAKLFQNVDQSRGKTGEPPARGLRETREGPDSEEERRLSIIHGTVVKRPD